MSPAKSKNSSHGVAQPSGTWKKHKSVVSASVLFKKPVKCLRATTIISPPTSNSPVNARSKLSKLNAVPGRLEAIVQLEPQHPLSVSFNESTSAYLDDLHGSFLKNLNAAHDSLITQLTESGQTASAFLAPKPAMVALAPTAFTKLLSEEVLHIRESHSLNENGVLTTLGAQFSAFKMLLESETKTIQSLARDLEEVVCEAKELAEIVLGKEWAIELGWSETALGGSSHMSTGIKTVTGLPPLPDALSLRQGVENLRNEAMVEVDEVEKEDEWRREETKKRMLQLLQLSL